MEQEDFLGRALSGSVARVRSAFLVGTAGVLLVPAVMLLGDWRTTMDDLANPLLRPAGAPMPAGPVFELMLVLLLAAAALVILFAGLMLMLRGVRQPDLMMVNYRLEERGLLVIHGPDAPMGAAADILALLLPEPRVVEPVIIRWADMDSVVPTEKPPQIALLLGPAPAVGRHRTYLLNGALQSADGVTLAERLPDAIREHGAEA